MGNPVESLRERMLLAAIENARGRMSPAADIVTAAAAFEAYITGGVKAPEPTLGDRIGAGIEAATQSAMKTGAGS